MTVGDEEIRRAFRLGWDLAELYKATWAGPWPPIDDSGDPPIQLPLRSELDANGRYRILRGSVQVEFSALATCLEPAGLTLRALPESATYTDLSDPARRSEVLEVHNDVYRALSEADFRLGKTYGLGRSLADTCVLSRDATSFHQFFKHYRIQELAARLSDSESSFPTHSAKAVCQGLEIWERWVNTATRCEKVTVKDPEGREHKTDACTWDEALRIDDVKLGQQLSRQTLVWHSLLSGEKGATTLLGPQDYAKASVRMLERFVTEYRSLLVGALLISLGAAAVVGLIVLGLGSLLGGVDKVFATVATVATAIGLSWAGIASSVRSVLAKTVDPVWKAEVGEAVAVASFAQPSSGVAGPTSRPRSVRATG